MRLLKALLLLACAVGCDRAPERRDLFLTRTHTKDGLTAHYVVFVPPNRDPAEKLPVILFLNGWGENGTDGLRQISNNFGGDVWRMRGWFPFLVVSPQCSYNAEWKPGSRNAAIAMSVLDEAIAEFNGDRERVIATGASTGATGALNIAAANPDRFAAVTLVSAPISLDPVELARSRLNVWAFSNEKDSAGLTRAVRVARREQFQYGNSPFITEFNQGGHNAWDAAYSSPALYRWMLEQRTGSPPAPRMTYHSPDQLLKSWIARRGDSWRVEGDELVNDSATSADLWSPEAFRSLYADVWLEKGTEVIVSVGGRISLDFAFVSGIRLRLADDGVCTASSLGFKAIDSVAQRALRPGWNDVRLSVGDGRLDLCLNGWKTSVEMDELKGSMQWALGHPGGTTTRWRYVRTLPDVAVRP
jgi:poly(3-hydroxybutyrate) depolymerase